MTLPIPFNTSAEDDLFDDALSRVLSGDRSALDDVDPELRLVVANMTRLAQDAGWLGADPGVSPRNARRTVVSWRTVANVLAATLTIALVAGLLLLGSRMLLDESGTPTPTPQSMMAASPRQSVSSGTCDRKPVSDDELLRYGREPATWSPAPVNGDPGTDSELRATFLQVVEDWNACLVNGDVRRAMAYEDPLMLGHLNMEPTSWTPVATGSDAEILAQMESAQRTIPPIVTGDAELDLYSVEFLGRLNDGTASDAHVLVVPVDDSGEWTAWFTSVTLRFDGQRWSVMDADNISGPNPTPVAVVPGRR